MEPAHIISADASLLDAIGEITRHQYVLVADEKHKNISGIVTTSDLSEIFREISEPFILLQEIESHVRRLILNGGFEAKELRKASDPKEKARSVNDVYDLTFGDYKGLLERKES